MIRWNFHIYIIVNNTVRIRGYIKKDFLNKHDILTK